MTQITEGIMQPQQFIITSLLRQNFVMNCLDFSDNHFNKAVEMVQGSFTRDIGISILRTFWKPASATST